jgi:hypothetical protein
MSNYTIYIDESGKFERTKSGKDSFVGGFITKNFNSNEVENKIKDLSNNINLKIEDKNYHFNYKKNMHFVPLHILEDPRRKEENITLPIKYVSELINGIFESVEKSVLLVFKSKGFPKYFYDTETIYTNILRSTILQAIKYIQEVEEKSDISINIVVASKVENKRFDYSETKESNFKEQLELGLKEEFRSFFNTITINFNIDYASKNMGLQIADFFCGALRDQFKKYKYLENFNVRVFTLVDSFYQSKSSIDKAQDLYEFDETGSILIALKEISFINNNRKIELFINDNIEKTIEKFENQLIKELDLFLEDICVTNQDKYLNLPSIKRFLDNTLKLIVSKNNEIFNKKIELLVQKYVVKLDSHTGSIDLTNHHNYLKKLDSMGYLLFNNRYSLLQEILSNTLRAVPISFNSFNFDFFEKKIENEAKNYKQLLPMNYESTDNFYDDNLAKIEGTLGQMYSYLSDMYKKTDIEHSNMYYDLAKDSLEKDLKYCVPKTKNWETAIGYLITLFFKSSDIENSTKYFNLITNNTNVSRIFNFNDLSEYSERSFILLHRLYICNLYSHLQNKKITNLDTIKDNLKFKESINNYPYINTYDKKLISKK